jgi:hypothetical protein
MLGRDPLTMGYLDNEFPNKYKIILKNRKTIYRYVFLLID